MPEAPGPATGVRVRTVTIRGDSAKVVPAYATVKRADLVVIDRDHGGARPRRRGRLAGSLARATTCPVLIVPAQRDEADVAPSGGFREIVCAVDFTLASAVAMRAALDLAVESAVGLSLLHVLDVPRQMLFPSGEAGGLRNDQRQRAGEVSARLWREVPAGARRWCDVRPVVVTGPVSAGILRRTSEVGADLVVLGVTPRSAWKRTLLGSTSAAVVRDAPCAVLLVSVPAGAQRWAGNLDTAREDAARHGHTDRSLSA
jgi:nucleotide-binding universal stress UspA family protein